MCISLSKLYISVADNAWHCYKNQKFMASFSQFQQPLENPVHWGSLEGWWRVENSPEDSSSWVCLWEDLANTHPAAVQRNYMCRVLCMWLCVTLDCIFPHAFLCAPKLPSWSYCIRRRTSRVHSGSLLCISNASSFFSSYFTELFFQPCWYCWHWLSSWFCGRSWVTHKFGD